jgi:hypothetical protein
MTTWGKFMISNKRQWIVGLAVVLPGLAFAEMNVQITGFIRQETSVMTGDANRFNQGYGNIYNGKTVINSFGTEVTRDHKSSENDWNLFGTRAEIDFKFRFTDAWEGFVKLRGFYEWQLDDEFDGIDMFDSGFSSGRGSTFETNDEQWMLDIPSMYLDYNKGAFWLRMGMQQIAWGEAIFFRVFDVVNGLDLRRHSFLDVAAEEYSDKRVPSLGLRGSYRFDNDWEIEAFAQHFRPTVLSPLDTPYNFVGSQFVIDQSTGWSENDDKVNFGMRLSGRVGGFDLQFMYTHRYNPDGTFRWTESGINPFAGSGDPALEGLGGLLAQTAFEIHPDGVWSADEWFSYASFTRLDGIDGLNASINDFQPATGFLGAFEVNDANCQGIGIPDLRACAEFELDFFFDTTVGGLGPLKGHIIREYHDEDIFGVGFNYVFNGKPNGLFDQLILRAEATYTKDRMFTNIGLDRELLEEDEFISNLSLEKYHRFTSAFPATYFVLQWMHKSESDMLGRHLSGMDNDGTADGDSNFNAIAFALQQPFPGLIWRADLAVLYDVQGGVLIQPGMRWRPRDNFQVDVYYNYIEGGNDNKDVMATFEDMDELFGRFTWYF